MAPLKGESNKDDVCWVKRREDSSQSSPNGEKSRRGVNVAQETDWGVGWPGAGWSWDGMAA